MADYIEEFNAIAVAQREGRRARDLEDYHNELHGNEVGRLPRFLSLEAREALAEGRSGRGSKSSFSTLDWLLLNDPDFARTYERAMVALGEAEEVVQTALDKAIAKAEETQLALDSLMDKAMRLSDGRAVFMDQSGIVRDENGSAIDPALADTLEWQGYEPAFEEFESTRDEDNRADAHVLTIRNDQAELGIIRQEITDTNNPPTTQRVDELYDRIEEIKADNEMIAPVSEQTVDHTSTIATKVDLSLANIIK